MSIVDFGYFNGIVFSLVQDGELVMLKHWEQTIVSAIATDINPSMVALAECGLFTNGTELWQIKKDLSSELVNNQYESLKLIGVYEGEAVATGVIQGQDYLIQIEVDTSSVLVEESYPLSIQQNAINIQSDLVQLLSSGELIFSQDNQYSVSQLLSA